MAILLNLVKNVASLIIQIPSDGGTISLAASSDSGASGPHAL